MPTNPDDSISTVRQRLLDGMGEYMRGDEDEPDEDWDCGYTCRQIIDEYLASFTSERSLSQDDIRGTIKKAVLDLNELNDRCDAALIETDQREDLCELLLVAARRAGLDTDEDITEEWREW